jgi:hypothetical protein
LDTISTGQVVDSYSSEIGCAAIFEYCITEGGGAKRMGQVYGVWDATSGTGTDVSSPDLNGSTSGFI